MAKYAAVGVQFRRATVVIAQVRSISGWGLSMDTIDVTSHDSTGAWREFVAGLIDGGEITLDLVFDPDNTGHTNLRTDLTSRTSNTYDVRFVDPTPQIWSFTGFVTAFSPDASVDGDLTASVTIKATGAITVT